MKCKLMGLVFAAAVFVPAWASAAGDAAAGEAVFNRVCKMCHGMGMMGAPKFGDKAAWAPRIAQGEAVLTEHAIQGIRKMPPKGTCASCSEQDIANAVAYMVSHSQ